MQDYKKTFRLALLGVIFILLFYTLYKVWSILLPFFFGGFFAYLLAPLVRKLEKKGLNKNHAILTVYSIVFGSLIILSVIGFPKIINELTNLVINLPEFTKDAEKYINNFHDSFANYDLPLSIKGLIDERITKVEHEILNFIRLILSILTNSISYIILLIVTPVVAFYLLKDSEILKREVENLIPKALRPDAFALLRDMDDVIAAYIRGHLIVSLIVGTLTGIAMYIIGVKYAFIIGIIAALTEIIPYFGPFIGAVPAITIALFQSVNMAVKATIIIIIIQQLETNIISPKIIGESIGLHPLTIIFVILAGGELYGVAGMLIAVPITAIGKVFGRYIYLKLVG